MNKKESAASAVWIAHGLVMNGGVLHCVESLSKRELSDAIAGFRLFGLPEAATVFIEAKRANPNGPDSLEATLDAAYSRAVPDDDALAAHVDAAFPKEQSPPAHLSAEDAISWAIDTFIEASADAAMLSAAPGKTRQQHRAARAQESALKQLLQHWDQGGHDALIRLLDHPDDVVRVSAASYLTGTDPDMAVPILERLQEGGGPAGASAHMMLFVMRNMKFTDPLEHVRKQL